MNLLKANTIARIFFFCCDVVLLRWIHGATNIVDFFEDLVSSFHKHYANIIVTSIAPDSKGSFQFGTIILVYKSALP